MSFEEAAAVPLAAMTALQAIRKYKGDLAGKTVFVPAGCMKNTPPLLPCSDKIAVSGTGLYALQIAKKVYGAKVITTVSTSKVPLIKELFGEGVIDESLFP
jgi:NADPH:quinone reductase-like Zn-dependent oxidoreductase